MRKKRVKIKEDHLKVIVLEANGTEVAISKSTGLVTYFDVNGKSMFEKGYCLKPNFWRAPTDNDFGADVQKKVEVWKNPEMKLVSFEQLDNNIIKSKFELPSTQSTLCLTYTLNTNGELLVEQELTVDDTAPNMPELLRSGMELQMPEEYENIEYYGKGPGENYVDRQSSYNLGVYHQKVSDQFYPYVRPQETGNKTLIPQHFFIK